MKGKYLLLGSNLGDRLANIKTALKHLSRQAGAISSFSSLYVTASWGRAGQPDYYNMVVRIETAFDPAELMNILLHIENIMGRSRNEKWESRIIDIDILYFDDLVIDEAGLKIPHPQIPNRRFTLAPLAEIAPLELHPSLRISNYEMLQAVADNGSVEILMNVSEAECGNPGSDFFNKSL